MNFVKVKTRMHVTMHETKCRAYPWCIWETSLKLVEVSLKFPWLSSKVKTRMHVTMHETKCRAYPWSICETSLKQVLILVRGFLAGAFTYSTPWFREVGTAGLLGLSCFNEGSLYSSLKFLPGSTAAPTAECNHPSRKLVVLITTFIHVCLKLFQ